MPNVDPENIYRISGSISGDEVGTRLSSAGGALSLEVQYGANFAASCSVGPHANGGRDYVCEFVDPGTGVVTLAASASSPYVLEYSEPVTLDQNEILGPNLVVTATAVSTRRIYGEIRNINVPLKNNEILTPSINPFGSIDCSQLILESLSNEPGRDRSSYDCTVPAGLLTVDYIVSPGCYRNQGTQYKLELEPSVGTELTNDSGSLSLELNSMTDQQVNVTIKLSPDICEPKPK